MSEPRLPIPLKTSPIKTAPKRVRLSVVIPCASKHAPHLPALVRALEAQTSPADELVVVLSEPAKVPLRAGPRLIVVRSPARSNAARNRNLGTDRATGDVICYQDADDLPHPQRLEIVRRIFERRGVEHLMHGFAYASAAAGAWGTQRYDVASLVERARIGRTYAFELGITNGNPACSRALARRVRWPEDRRVGEDVAFNQAACAASRANAIVRAPLLLYRQHLSAGLI